MLGGFDRHNPPMPGEDVLKRCGQLQRPDIEGGSQAIERVLGGLANQRIGLREKRIVDHEQRAIDAVAFEPVFQIMEKPVMTAKDDNFKWGQIGVGTFDDTADIDNLELRGVKVSKPVEAKK